MQSLYRGNYQFSTYIATAKALQALALCGEIPELDPKGSRLTIGRAKAPPESPVVPAGIRKVNSTFPGMLKHIRGDRGPAEDAAYFLVGETMPVYRDRPREPQLLRVVRLPVEACFLPSVARSQSQPGPESRITRSSRTMEIHSFNGGSSACVTSPIRLLGTCVGRNTPPQASITLKPDRDCHRFDSAPRWTPADRANPIRDTPQPAWVCQT